MASTLPATTASWRCTWRRPSSSCRFSSWTAQEQAGGKRRVARIRCRFGHVAFRRRNRGDSLPIEHAGAPGEAPAGLLPAIVIKVPHARYILHRTALAIRKYVVDQRIHLAFGVIAVHRDQVVAHV